MAQRIRLDFCWVTFYDSYMVCEMDEGIHLTVDYHIVLDEIAESIYQDSPFVYISLRVNSYSVDPTIYYETSKINNLLGFAVVSKIPLAVSNTTLEKMFLDKPFAVFEELDEAMAWAKEVTDNKGNRFEYEM